MQKLSQFDFDLPERITMHVSAGAVASESPTISWTRLGGAWVISETATVLQPGVRWILKGTNSWHARGFRKLQICTEVRMRIVDVFIALTNSIITTRHLNHGAWARHPWEAKLPRES